MPVGAVIGGRYRLERPLAAGGMGSVWVARHQALDEPVAIKFMNGPLPHLAEARIRFVREARAAARLRNPHVVQVLDFGVDGAVPYLVMELLDGEHLGDRLRRTPTLPLARVAHWANQIAKALGHAHRAGIVHRDLKPANIFLAQVAEDEVVKVLDFGIAKANFALDSDITSTNLILGSPQYMSPEQARGRRDVDHRADLWAFGAILFRALTGVTLFEGDSPIDVIVEICTSPVPKVSTVAPHLPKALDAFFARALHREPDRRFGSAAEMAAAFASLAGGVEISPIAASGPVEGAGGTSGRRRSATARRSDRDPRSVFSSEGEVDGFVEEAFAMLMAPPKPPLVDNGASRGPESTVPNHRGVIRQALERASATPGAKPRTEPYRSRASLPDSSRRSALAAPAPLTTTAAMFVEQGFMCLRRGDRDQALECWQEALILDPENRALRANIKRLRSLLAGPKA